MFFDATYIATAKLLVSRKPAANLLYFDYLKQTSRLSLG